jgi:two-component system NarL family sensor kinase
METAIIATSIVLLVLGVFIITFLVIFFLRQKQNKMAKEAREAEFVQELLQAQLEIQEQTLKNISQEIHDNIGQMLSLAKLNLALVETDETNPRISDSHQLVSKAIQDLRDLSKSLDTDYVMQMGLPRAIEYELEMINKTGISKTNFQLEGQTKRIDKQKELILFRIVQESLNNIIKHAEAKHINVVLNYNDTGLSLSIHDDGKGVDLTPLNEETNSAFGLGIRNMHNRARLIGANFNMHSVLQEGTNVSIQLPYNVG